MALFGKGVLKVCSSGWAPNPYGREERRPWEEEELAAEARACMEPQEPAEMEAVLLRRRVTLLW